MSGWCLDLRLRVIGRHMKGCLDRGHGVSLDGVCSASEKFEWLEIVCQESL